MIIHLKNTIDLHKNSRLAGKHYIFYIQLGIIEIDVTEVAVTSMETVPLKIENVFQIKR